jgi:hypothetical protein
LKSRNRSSIDGRLRNGNGQIDRKHGNTLVGTLRETYGENFAHGRRADMKLSTLLYENGVESLSQFRRANKYPKPIRGYVTVADKKVIFVAFAIEDQAQRDFLKGQSLNTKSPFEYVDMSVKDAYQSEWKDRVCTRIRRSDGVVALISRNSLASTGQKWEIQCAKEEKKPLRGIWAYTDDRTKLDGVNTMVWTWDNIKSFIDSL